MNALDRLCERLADAGTRPALVSDGGRTGYDGLLRQVEQAERHLRALGCAATTVLLVGDYAERTIGYLLALWKLGNVVALLCDRDDAQAADLATLSEAAWRVTVRPGADVAVDATGATPRHPLLVGLHDDAEPGVVIFSSGSTGTPKASVHRALPLLERHVAPKRRFTSISFLLFDHIGGLNTLLYVLFNQGTLVVPASRAPDTVAAAIERHGVQTLTTSPTFLNLLVFSGALERYDLGSLAIVNYGTERMPASLLAVLAQRLPRVRFAQAYGATETGVIPARSVSSTSTWITFDERECDVRVVDGLLEVKTKTSMLGYLNAPSPFTEDGYFKTGDAVLKEGNMVQVLGRTSDLINVGGEKVYPAEIESVLRELEGVVEVHVGKQENPIVGHMVTATFRLQAPEAPEAFRTRLYTFCRDRLPPARIPRQIRLTTEHLHSARYKKMGAGAIEARLATGGGHAI